MPATTLSSAEFWHTALCRLCQLDNQSRLSNPDTFKSAVVSLVLPQNSFSLITSKKVLYIMQVSSSFSVAVGQGFTARLSALSGPYRAGQGQKPMLLQDFSCDSAIPDLDRP